MLGNTQNPAFLHCGGALPLAEDSSIQAPRRPVAQLDRALPSEGKGRTFESYRVHHKNHDPFWTDR